jgi:type VI secretion system protein ImpJ
MPDCLVVSYGARRDDPLDSERDQMLEADLTAHEAEFRQGPLTVYLAVPARSADTLSRSTQRRYESVPGAPVADETTGLGELSIPRLRPRLSLRVTNAPPQDYVTLPLARVEHKDNTYSLVADFAPPAVTVSRKTPLGKMCSDLAVNMRNKAVYLTDKLRGPAEAGRALDLGLLRSLVTPLPLLEAVLATDSTHPYQVYLTLCTIAGHVSMMGRGVVPPRFPAYDHDDPWKSFELVIKFIEGKMGEGVRPAYAERAFRYEDGFYNLMFEGEWTTRRLVLGLRPPPGMTEQELIRWGNECLIGSRPNMRLMRETRILGARRELAEPDDDLVAPRGVVLFSFKPDSEFVEPNEVLQIFNAGERGQRVRPAEIVLYIKGAGL